MKVLFLDIDGVVNCSSTTQRFEPCIGIDPKLVAIVQRIVDSTGCVIVLSSSWRLPPPEMVEHVKTFFTLHDVTVDKRGLTDRGCEVQDWLDHHEPVEAYAILDDNSDFHKNQPLFKTDWNTGITDEIADKVIKSLAT